MNIAQYILIGSIRLYRVILSPMQQAIFGPGAGCRYTPTCSMYAMDAVRKHGALKGTLLTANRLCRCHPWGGCGPDPVPEHYHIHIPGIRHFKFSKLGHGS